MSAAAAASHAFLSSNLNSVVASIYRRMFFSPFDFSQSGASTLSIESRDGKSKMQCFDGMSDHKDELLQWMPDACARVK